MYRDCDNPASMFGGSECIGINSKPVFCDNCSGCFNFIEYEGNSIQIIPHEQASTVFDCQIKCQEKDGCDIFMFALPDSGFTEGCHLKRDTNDTTDNVDFLILSGPVTCPSIFIYHIMLRDLLTQKCVHKKRLLILDTPEQHVDSENIKLKIGSRPAYSTNFFQNVIFSS
jgi:hypothetical protein